MDLWPSSFQKRLFHLEYYCIDRARDQAAVLLPLQFTTGGWQVIFTRRSDHVRDHKGQVAFPGGGVEPADVSLAQTALRESSEEIGTQRSDVELLGCLEQRQAVTGVTVFPFVGVIQPNFSPKPAETEVSRVFSVPIAWLQNTNNWKEKPFVRGNHEVVTVITYEPHDGEIIWGLTARILHDFLSKI